MRRRTLWGEPQDEQLCGFSAASIIPCCPQPPTSSPSLLCVCCVCYIQVICHVPSQISLIHSVTKNMPRHQTETRSCSECSMSSPATVSDCSLVIYHVFYSQLLYPAQCLWVFKQISAIRLPILLDQLAHRLETSLHRTVGMCTHILKYGTIIICLLYIQHMINNLVDKISIGDDLMPLIVLCH